jgi:methylmalonyl-CoA/ethylmalonyl-CoA epimerase
MISRLSAEGFTLLNEAPKRGADNKLVCFVHPKSAGGVLVELCMTADVTDSTDGTDTPAARAD